MTNKLREQIGKPPFYHMYEGTPYYLDGAGIRHVVPKELIKLIRTATLDEAKEAVNKINSNEWGASPGRVKVSAMAAIEKLRRNTMTYELNPWQQGILANWSICGMNHYHVNGEKFLFVTMVKDDRCITVEGKDDKYLWNRLFHKADLLEVR